MPDITGQFGPQPTAADSLPRAAIVVSVYNRTVTDAMLDGARAAYAERGGHAEDIEIFTVPGTFELPLVCAHACRDGRFGVVVALGCVLRGETDHDRYISHAVADQIAQLSCETGIPVGFGVLTVNTPEQAIARSSGGDAPGGKGNKGRETMDAVLDVFETIVMIRSGRHSEGGEPSGTRPRDKIADGLKQASPVRSGAVAEGHG